VLAEKPQAPMTRRKSEITPKRIDQEYPHQIEITTPSGGLKNIWETDAFCRECGFQFAMRDIGELRRADERDAVRYCFKNVCHAYAFQAAFGGERVVLPTKKPPASSIARRGLWNKRRERD
jgi:hypothetical protein